MSVRRFQVENHSRWLGWTVKEHGKRRIAVFSRRADARDYARALNLGVFGRSETQPDLTAPGRAENIPAEQEQKP